MPRHSARCCVLVLALEATAHARPAAGRYLYEIYCSARVDRFDAVAGRRTNTYDLARRTGKTRLIPGGERVLEVCLTNQAVFDAGASVFYTLVPSQGQPREDGTMDYRIVGFSVPGIAVVKQMAGGVRREHPPRLEIRSGTVRAISQDEQGSVKAQDLSAFGPDRKDLPNKLLETSGDQSLVHLTAHDELTIGVADRAAKTLVVLQGLPRTTSEHVHLSPGGTYVLIEELATAGVRAAKTGKLLLFDSKTGLVVKSISDSQIVKLFFRGISPSGKVLYDTLDSYRFIDVGVSFPAEPVARPSEDDFPQPAVFFADR